MERSVEFQSDGITLRGFLHIPEGATAPRPVIISCHGFVGSCQGVGHPQLARSLEAEGYIVLRFDFRGCGTSGGEPARIICDEQVSDIGNAITFAQSIPEADAARIVLIGASLG